MKLWDQLAFNNNFVQLLQFHFCLLLWLFPSPAATFFQTLQGKKWGYLSIYHVYFKSCCHKNVRNDWFCFFFCWWKPKTSHSLGKIFMCIWEILLSSSKNGMVNRYWRYFEILRVKISKKLLFLRVVILLMTVQPNNLQHFLKKLNKSFKIHLNMLPKLWLMFCCHQQNIQKMSQCWHFNDHKPGSKYDQ